ncbi:hypothetical protein GR702_11485 [Novosphingobium sp. FGD1]|uniref:Uncharacterized protein n=1 Tax=Novosphingobium silvae TaxID=2692619 RepID=A0A7X4GGV8_9SPHN|nr:hypothetical protein [Novosphingobium silvae]MYL98385.1 hypothetical protein [Novosphingobium silvae]
MTKAPDLTLTNGTDCKLLARGLVMRDGEPLASGLWRGGDNKHLMTVGTDTSTFDISASHFAAELIC